MRARLLAVVGGVAVAGIAACSVAERDTGTGRSAILDGTADTTDLPHANAVVFVTNDASPTTASILGKCSGTLIAPNVVLTAKHCLEGTPEYPGGVGEHPYVAVGTVNQWKDRPLVRSRLSTKKTTTNVTSLEAPLAMDLALVILDPVGLDEDVARLGISGSTWERIFQMDSLASRWRRPTFEANYTPPSLAFTYTIPPNRGVAGWGRAGSTQDPAGWQRSRLVGTQAPTGLFSLSIQAQYGLFLEHFTGTGPDAAVAQTEGGDSGGPLFLQQSDGFRDVKGVIHGTYDNSGQRHYAFVDITTPENVAWIKSNARDASHDGQPNWLNKHAVPLVNGVADWWYGEVEYYGPRDVVNDADGDHWRDDKDNCPNTWNPAQTDTDDDGIGDACTPGNCTCDTLGDVDGDGWCTVGCYTTIPGPRFDNCPKDFNPWQENCNLNAERARQSMPFGDVCDPVPCPASNADEVAEETETCKPNPDDGCTLVSTHPDIATVAIGAHYATSLNLGVHKAGDPQLGAFKSVRDVNTKGRYCNASISPPIDCLAAQVVGDGFLVGDDTDRNLAWHKITLGYQFGLNPPQPLPYGTDWTLDYDGTPSTTHWTYALDVTRWFQGTAWIAGATTDCDKKSALTCTPGGALWLHSDSPVGSAPQFASVDGVQVGVHGEQLSNNYFPTSVEAGLKYCYAHLPFALSYTPPPAPKLQAEGSGAVLVQSAVDLGEVLGHPRGAAEFVLPIGDGDLAVAGTRESALSSVRFNLAERSSCGPKRATPEVVVSMATHVISIPTDASSAPASPTITSEVSADGTQMTGLIQLSAGQLVRLAVAQPPGNQPNARTRFMALYSAVRGGTFVVGGEKGGEPLHDVWFAQDGEGWTELTPIQGGSLQEVLAATYGVGDGKLWVLDAPAAGATGGLVRLATLDLEKRELAVVATWSHAHTTYSYALSTDRDGGVLVQATSATSSVIAKVGASGWTRVDNEAFGLARGVAADRHGYTFLVRSGSGVRSVRHTSLTGTSASWSAMEPWF